MPPDGLAVSDAVLADRVKSVDHQARKVTVAGHVPDDVLADVKAKIAALLDLID